MKAWRGVFKSRAGNQYVTLLARDRAEAKILLEAYNQRRAGRELVTFKNLGDRLAAGDISQAAYDHTLEKRRLDFSRYDTITPDGVEPAEHPMKLDEIEEVNL